MAYPLPVQAETIITPPARPTTVVGRITSPVAVTSDTYLGGFARGNRFVYLDESHFVWWRDGT